MKTALKPDVGDRPRPPKRERAQTSAVRRRIPEYLTIATLVSPWGTRGEIKTRIETDFPERFAGLSRVLVGPEHEPFEIEGMRPYREQALLKLKGVDDPESARALNGMAVQVPVAEAVPLAVGHYYVHEIEGLEVLTEEGESLGVIAEVLFAGGNPIYVTQGPRGEVLIPRLEGVVRQVDLEAGHMIVHVPAGLLD